MTRKSFAKVNIFLKIAGKRDNYHELVSRFVRVHSLYDTVSFEEGSFTEFTLEGEFGCQTQKNTVYKAYVLLKQQFPHIEQYFTEYKVVIDKKIPEFAGLGGGSSNAATFMLMVNEACQLGLSKDELNDIGVQIGADVPFFLYEYDSANVTGIGEIVEKFDEPLLDIETVTPKVQCNTGAIFKAFREKFYQEITQEESKKLLSMDSKAILERLSIDKANDLYNPAIDQYEELKSYAKANWYFSGSGSSFFKVVK